MVDKTECHTKMAAKAPEATLETPRTRMKRHPDSAQNSAQNSLRNSARTALETKHGSAQNGAEIALDTTPKMAPKPTPKRRPNRPRICTGNKAKRRTTHEAQRRQAKRNGDKRSAMAQDDMHRYSEARCYQSTNLTLSDAVPQCRSAMHEAPRRRMKLRCTKPRRSTD